MHFAIAFCATFCAEPDKWTQVDLCVDGNGKTAKTCPVMVAQPSGMLSYCNTMFLDVLHSDGLVVTAKGLGVEHVIFNLIQVCCNLDCLATTFIIVSLLLFSGVLRPWQPGPCDGIE